MITGGTNPSRIAMKFRLSANYSDLAADRLYPRLQNSSRASNAIIRGELSPPNPTPNSPVGGEVG